MEVVKGYIERITFQSEDNGFTVAKLKENSATELVCIVGTMPAVQPGVTITAQGRWKINSQHGKQFEVNDYNITAPSDVIGIKKYLESGLIKGIGPAYARRIVKLFGSNTLEIIDKQPDRLSEVPGIGKRRIKIIKECWKEQSAIREVMIFLQSYGISPGYAQKIFRYYGKKSIDVVQKNPYTLSRNIFGIGFKTADTIAAKMGISGDNPQRIQAGIEHILFELSSGGHTCYPVEGLLPIAQEMLQVPLESVHDSIVDLEAEERVIVSSTIKESHNTSLIWHRKLYISERGIAKEISRLRNTPSILRNFDKNRALAWVQKELSITLASKQEKAVKASLCEKLHIITGGPGTGKSTIINAILKIMNHLTTKVALAAPTGRAAKRMTEITGREAKTIHSLLKFDFNIMGFRHNKDNPLDLALVIIDEASMIDTYLMYSLLKAIPSHARLILVGDIDQLPSVGPGNVLRDIIDSQRIPVTILSEIFRQAKGSTITLNAHRINNGDFPFINNRADSDFFFIEADCYEKIIDNIINLVTSRLPKKYDFNPIGDIQVLAPMKRGPIGTENLNRILQKAVNGKCKGGISRRESIYFPGDKVMQIRNNYKKEVFNGDVGYINSIDNASQEVFINIDGRLITYYFHELDEIALAYAVSVHKYQGSECPCIVMPIHTAHFKLLHRNLFYTGVTRGKKIVVIVGTKKAIAIAVNNNEVDNRYTALKEALLNMEALK